MPPDTQSLVVADSGVPHLAPTLSPHVVERLIANQTKELELKTSELALQQQKDTNSFAYARDALKAQVEDRKDARSHRCKMKDRLFFFIFGMGLLIAILIIYCLYSGHEVVALEIIKFLAYAGIGSVGGYGYGKSRGSKASQDISDN